MACLNSSRQPGRPIVNISGLKSVSGGWETDIWFFTATDQSGRQEDLVLRIYPGLRSVRTCEHEGRTMKQLEAAGYPVPAIHLVGLDPVYFGGPFLVMDRLSGPVMGIETCLDELPAFLQLFVRLHRLDWRPFAADAAALEQVPPEERLPRGVADFRRQFAARGREPMMAPCLDWLERRVRGVVSPTYALTHNDFHPLNVLHRADGSLAVIDWPSANVQDYRVDLAWTWMLIRAYGGAEAAEAVLRGYEAVAGRPVEHFDLFVVAALARRLSDLVIAMQEGAGSVGMRPGMEEEFRRQAGHVRFIYDLMREMIGARLPAVEAVLG